MLYGKMINSNNYGFGVFENRFENYIEIDDDEHWALVQKANKENKIIVPDNKGYPTLADRPPPSEKETAQNKLSEYTHYLNSTDWYVIRFTDEGTPIPEEVQRKRHKARIEISRLREIVKS